MKKTLYILLAALCAACSNDKEAFDTSIPDGMGIMRFNVDVIDQVKDNASTRAWNGYYMMPDSIVPTEDDLKLKIYQVSYDEDENKVLTLYKEYASLTDYNDALEEDEDDDINSIFKKSPYMPAGDYFATIDNGLDIKTENETNAYFADSLEFTIVARETEAKENVMVMLQNSAVRLQVTENFNTYFPGGATLTLSTEDEARLTITLPFEEDYKEAILFVVPETNLYLEGTAIKQDPGTGVAPTVKFTRSKFSVARKGYLNTVIVDAGDAGSATIKVTVNDQITVLEPGIVDLHE